MRQVFLCAAAARPLLRLTCLFACLGRRVARPRWPRAATFPSKREPSKRRTRRRPGASTCDSSKRGNWPDAPRDRPRTCPRALVPAAPAAEPRADRAALAMRWSRQGGRAGRCWQTEPALREPRCVADRALVRLCFAHYPRSRHPRRAGAASSVTAQHVLHPEAHTPRVGLQHCGWHLAGYKTSPKR